MGATTRLGLVAAAVGSLIVLSPVQAQQREPADLIITGGVVYTADAMRPRAEAVAVKGGRIVFVGSAQEAAVLRGAQTRVIDASGQMVMPGMIDAHGHLPGLGSALRAVDLVGTRSVGEIIAKVAARAAQLPAGSWIIGRGWDQNDWADTRFPTHDALSRAVPDHPVMLERVDGHATFVNAKAIQLAGITRSTKDPSGGRILRDAAGNATGVLIDNASNLVLAKMPAETRAEQREGILLAQTELNRFGLTGIGDAGVERATIELYEELAREGRLTVRNNVMVAGSEENLKHFFQVGPRDNIDGNHMLSVRAIKLQADGALGSRGAHLIEPYSDDPQNTGLVLEPKQRIQDVAVRALRSGFQLNVHAIGDAANRETLDAIEAALKEVPTADHRFRIEHAQIVHRNDIPRFVELGIIPSMETVHQTSDMYWAENRLGWTRLLGAYAWRSFLNSGAIIAGGSDFPVESPNPLLSFYAAVTRQDAEGWPVGGWFGQQIMTREEALNHLTIWPAYASFQEQHVGSITTGKLADIVILSQDIMKVPAQQILKTVVEKTIVGGKLVYDRGARQTS